MSEAEPLVCRWCGAVDPRPEMSCDGGRSGGILRDHFVGTDRGCQFCGRLVQACAARPCGAISAGWLEIEDAAAGDED